MVVELMAWLSVFCLTDFAYPDLFRFFCRLIAAIVVGSRPETIKLLRSLTTVLFETLWPYSSFRSCEGALQWTTVIKLASAS